MQFGNFLVRKKNSLHQTNNFKSDFLSPLLLIPLILVSTSSLLIHSVQRQFDYSDSINHFLTGLIGYLMAIFISYIPLERLRNYIFPFYVLTLISLIAVYFFGISFYGAQRWLSLGFFTFQPSELAKLSTILALALVLDKKFITKMQDLILPSLVMIFPWILIFFQPDLGTSLVLIFLFLLMLYWSQVPIEWILILTFCLLTAIISSNLPPLTLFLWIPLMGYLAYRSFKKKFIFTPLVMGLHILVAKLTPFLWNVGLQDYQKNRLIIFLDPSRDPLGGGYHLLQSKIAIGSGGLLGTGILNGKLTNLQFIPEQHTDFIFSALGEEIGFLGSFIAIFMFFTLISKLLSISKNARTDFESLVVIGITATLLFQIIINIFMTIGLGPVTGIPLPFMSYGRTSLIINFISMGLVISVLKRTRSLRTK